ncbi:hippocampus abundant transcript 1 protein-like isoform X2 [Physella acuta]|uniref:hippocampus abundant transcript 1 protein-like isoform X2 n=1 Tax=Physella acuta TaxID=109671 RepID=UPI0027DAEC4D|nr:hippocampus abundant transcript 1 protein-like isoform X2 [Physella acuta]XP_059159088.1 hippocampus abundant transcript 1 protein-like isoform X2 [Physella acuta]
MMGKKRKRIIGNIIWSKKGYPKDSEESGLGQASIYHALVIIFLEFFAWGLLTSPIISVLNDTFPKHTFLFNGLIQGVKGLLSFLSAPLIGALSDVWGRKPFLLLTVGFTCAPIPLMRLSPWWYFAMLSISGVFSVTFSVVFAYVADVTTEDERSSAYGLVSATFAASLVTSPAIGAFLQDMYSENLVIWLASSIAILDVLFILVLVPESLPEKLRPASWGSQISWEKADPFGALKKVGQDLLILLLCVTVFLSYLPEAGEYSSIFVYLRLIMDFSKEEVASYIAVVGVLSVLAQTLILALLMKYIGHKQTIMFGLVFEIIQLTCYGFASQHWIIWLAGTMAAMSSIAYPSISSFVSAHASPDQQGVAQGVVTGIRGLCNGLGPALFGFIFYLFHVDLNEKSAMLDAADKSDNLSHRTMNSAIQSVVPGPPFAFGAVLVIMALLVAAFMPENPHSAAAKKQKLAAAAAFEMQEDGTGGKKHEIEPLITDTDVEL